MVVLNPRTGIAYAALFLCAVSAAHADGQSLTQDEALAMAYPGAAFDRRTAYLDDSQLARAVELAGPAIEVPSAIVTYYVARRGSEGLGVAYFDVHRVRTMAEVLMVVVECDGRVHRVETVSFREPPEYSAPAGWLDLFNGRLPGDDLSLKGSIPTIAGATLTAGAVTQAVRRVLALHAVIDPLARGDGGARCGEGMR